MGQVPRGGLLCLHRRRHVELLEASPKPMKSETQNEKEKAPLSFGEVTVFKNAMSTGFGGTVMIEDLLDSIQSGEWEKQINNLRWAYRLKQSQAYDEKKKFLCAVSLSAHLTTRDSKVPLEKKLEEHSGWLQGDFDAKDHDNFDLEKARQDLINDPHVGFVFTSPSGAGLKAGIRIDGSRHRESFFAAEQYYLKKYGLKLDKSVKDICRLCFVSYDPDLWRCDEMPEPVPIPDKIVASGNAKSLSQDYPPVTATDIEEMLSFLPPRPAYEDWLRISSSVWSELPFEEGTRLLNQWSPEEKEGEYRTKYDNRLDRVTIGTLIHLAKEKGYKLKRAKSQVGKKKGKKATKLVTFGDDFVTQCFMRNQTGDAELWLNQTNEIVRYDFTSKKWRIYDNGLWVLDETERVEASFPDLVGSFYTGFAKKIDENFRETPGW